MKRLNGSVVVGFVAAFNLTKIEIEIGFLILNGYSNARVSEELFISEATVKKHLSHLYEKTNYTGRKEFKTNICNSLSQKNNT